MPTKKKSRKMDKKLVAAKQKEEVRYISERFKIPQKAVRSVCKEAGRSRVKVYAKLREMGYRIPTRKFKSDEDSDWGKPQFQEE